MNEGNMFRFDLWLYNQMQRKGWNIEETAEHAGLSVTSIRHYLNNVRMPTMYNLAMLLNAFGMHLEIVEN